MDSDEDQQALAWQQIIRNKAFDNVRVRLGESWVDAACRTLDELVNQKGQAENATPKIVWRERALEAERYLMEARRELDEEKSRSQLFAARADKVNGERDAEASRADYLNKKFAKLMFDYQDVEDERDEWKARATPAVFDVDVERTIRAEFVEEGLRTKTPVEYRVVRAVCDLFGVETKQAVDPIEAQARELWEIGRGKSVNIEFDDIAPDHRAEYLSIARHLLGQEDRYVDQ